MAADTINSFFAEESGRIEQDILRRTTHISPWIDLVQTGPWTDEMGQALKVLTASRVLPADSNGNLTEPTWTDIVSDAGYGSAGGACLPTVTTLKGGADLEEFNLAQTALESETLCVTNFRSVFELKRQVAALKKGLVESTKFTLVERFRSEFARLCTNHILVTSQGAVESTTMPSGSGKTPAVMTNELLVDAYSNLVHIGATDSPLLMKADGSPLFSLFTSLEASRNLKRASGIRDDYRYNDRLVGELTKIFSNYGALSMPVDGFQHLIDPTPPRWQYSGGWVRVWPYVRVATDKGYKLIKNDAYRTAAWEDTFIFHPEVFKALFPKSITTAGEGTSFQPVQYRGDWKWLNIAHRSDNPDNTMGFWRGVFTMASEPLYSDFGYRIRHARCRNQTGFYAACS